MECTATNNYVSLCALKKKNKYIWAKFCEKFDFNSKLPVKKTSSATVQKYLETYMKFLADETRMCDYCKDVMVMK